MQKCKSFHFLMDHLEPDLSVLRPLHYLRQPFVVIHESTSDFNKYSEAHIIPHIVAIWCNYMA